MKQALKGNEAKIFFMLDHNENKTAEEMGQDLNISKRKARKIVEKMRLKGIPICSSSGKPGYWIAKSKQEYIEFKWHQVVSRLNALMRLSNAIERTLVDWEW